MAKINFLLKNISHGPSLAALAAIYKETDTSAMEVFGALLDTSVDVLAAINSALTRHGLSQARFRLLLILRRAGQRGLHPRELAENLGIERASVTSLLDGLEQDGLARRLPFQGDRRSIVVALTPKGTRLINALAPVRLKKVAKLMACLSRAERKTLITLLAKIDFNIPEFGKI